MRKLKEEYIGSEVEVVQTQNNTLTGLKGKIIDETKNTFKIKTRKSTKIVLKQGNTFKINKKIIKGNDVVKKPQDRIKIKG